MMALRLLHIDKILLYPHRMKIRNSDIGNRNGSALLNIHKLANWTKF